MKLHLHFGAHKTATTHFQNVLEANRELYDSNTNYICSKEIRKKLRWSNDRVNLKASQPYLTDIKQSSTKLIISEENLSGETKDIYRQLFLYSNLEKRLNSFKCFTKSFDEVEIWFGIRSMDGFLPSIYCESLRHWPYNKFNNVYAKNYNQTWLPVIKRIKNIFPDSRINVIRHEHYMDNLPSIIKRIFDTNELWDYLEDERPRVSMNHYAINLMNVAHFFIPSVFFSSTVQNISDLMYKNNIGYKFTPFSQTQIDDFLDIYLKDINQIKQLDNVFVY